MNLDDKHQRVPVPKWRALSNTPSTELVSSRNVQPGQELAMARTDRMHALYALWQETPTIDHALELLDCASFMDDKSPFYGSASQIINSRDVTKTSKFVAQRVIHPVPMGVAPLQDSMNKVHIRRVIANNRVRLRDQVRNGLLHAEQARLYAMIDETNAAESSFARALAAISDNRHILRSFARFMVHIGQPEAALSKLRKSSAIATDPWVQAAEIAISEHHHVGSKVAKSASKMLDTLQVRNVHVSELATALATLEWHSGNRKRFNKRFKESLSYPSENALAQATWFFREVPGEVPEEKSSLLVPMLSQSAEALTYDLLKKRKWDDAVQSFSSWQSEESFSEHIAIEGSFYAISFAQDYDSAISICQNGLLANSNSHSLLNNLCYAECRRGSLANAVKTMERLKSVYSGWKSSPVYLATDGMLSCSLGHHGPGRSRYVEALKSAQANNDEALSRRIKMHWIQEEALSGMVTRSQADRLVGAIQMELDKSGGSEEMTECWRYMKDQIVSAIAKSGGLHSEQQAGLM